MLTIFLDVTLTSYIYVLKDYRNCTEILIKKNLCKFKFYCRVVNLRAGFLAALLTFFLVFHLFCLHWNFVSYKILFYFHCNTVFIVRVLLFSLPRTVGTFHCLTGGFCVYNRHAVTWSTGCYLFDATLPARRLVGDWYGHQTILDWKGSPLNTFLTAK